MHPNIKTFGRFSYSSNPIEIISYSLVCNNFLHIGNHTSIGENCKVFLDEGNHNYKSGTTTGFPIDFNTGLKQKSFSRGDVYIGNDVWIGYGVTIMSGVTIGNGAVIAANSHVVSDVPPYGIYGGNPAKLIKYRFSEDIIDRFEQIQWWNYTDDKLKKVIPLLMMEPSNKILDLICDPNSLEIDHLASRHLDIKIIYDDLLHRSYNEFEMKKYLFSETSLEEIRRNIISSEEYKHAQQKYKIN